MREERLGSEQGSAGVGVHLGSSRLQPRTSAALRLRCGWRCGGHPVLCLRGRASACTAAAQAPSPSAWHQRFPRTPPGAAGQRRPARSGRIPPAARAGAAGATAEPCCQQHCHWGEQTARAAERPKHHAESRFSLSPSQLIPSGSFPG